MSSLRKNYVEMNCTELKSLERDRTVFFMSVSPIEVHGFHLPVGTDVFVAQEVGERLIDEFLQRYPEFNIVELPPLFLGADPVPFAGSVSISPGALKDVLYAFGRDLAEQGFKYMVLTDNHGGPRHQLAIYSAAKKLFNKYDFYLIDPFLTIYKHMIRHDPELIEFTGLGPGTCGDDADNHAGTNETSLAIAAGVKFDRAELPPSRLPEARGALKLVAWIAGILKKMGNEEAGGDLIHLVNTLAWVGQKPLIPYMGDPGLAQQKNGEAMLKYHVKVSFELLDKALKGKEILGDQKPLLAFLSFLV